MCLFFLLLWLSFLVAFALSAARQWTFGYNLFGGLTIGGVCLFVVLAIASLDFSNRLEYDRRYSIATKRLLEASLATYEAGNLDAVVGAWYRLDADCHPGKEAQDFPAMVDAAVARMEPPEP